jgi:hypothetical protein
MRSVPVAEALFSNRFRASLFRWPMVAGSYVTSGRAMI